MNKHTAGVIESLPSRQANNVVNDDAAGPHADHTSSSTGQLHAEPSPSPDLPSQSNDEYSASSTGILQDERCPSPVPELPSQPDAQNSTAGAGLLHTERPNGTRPPSSTVVMNTSAPVAAPRTSLPPLFIPPPMLERAAGRSKMAVENLQKTLLGNASHCTTTATWIAAESLFQLIIINMPSVDTPSPIPTLFRPSLMVHREECEMIADCIAERLSLWDIDLKTLYYCPINGRVWMKLNSDDGNHSEHLHPDSEQLIAAHEQQSRPAATKLAETPQIYI